MPHAQAVLRHASGLDTSIKDYATLLYNVGGSTPDNGGKCGLGKSIQKVYDLRREAVGNDDISTIGRLGCLDKYKQINASTSRRKRCINKC